MKKILLIDDERALTEILKLNLEDTGEFDVRTMNEAVHAAGTAREFLPDMILLDLVMPGKDGREVLEELRADPSTAGIPVIIISASTTAIKQHADKKSILGCPFIPKPVDIEHLVSSIHEHLKKAA